MGTKYIFITGGVVSSLGKGVTAASCGALLQSRGYTVHSRKFDPYLNIDPGTMSPLQHGEVYVTYDGHETDLDLGYYERFLNIKLSKNDSVSGGRIYWEVLNAERRGEYLGKTVQMIPHITNKIKEYIGAPTGTDFVICEIGGTVGDIEGKVFLESIRQFANDVGRRNVMFIHLTLAPYLEASGELKTKPTQMSVRRLLENGIQADLLIVRSPCMLNQEDREKIGMFCNLPARNVISGINVDNIYKNPLVYEQQDVYKIIAEHFGLDENKTGNLDKFRRIDKYLSSVLPTINIGVIGKYFDVSDAYKSLNEALFHAGIQNDVHLNIHKINAETFSEKDVKDIDGILVPGGFGVRGVEGKIAAAKYARETQTPYMGICLGMQVAVIEFARNVLGIKDANSSEFEKSSNSVIDIIPGKDGDLGGTLRLGEYPCVITPNTLAHKIFGKTNISERHRHRYEMMVSYEKDFAKHGMIISGKSPDGNLPEIVEISDHPFFIAGQFHPEFQSNPYTGHPMFNAFISAAVKHSQTKK